MALKLEGSTAAPSVPSAMPVTRKPAPVITTYGPPKYGKTILTGRILQGALYIQTKEDVTSPLLSFIEMNPRLGIVPPARIITIAEDGTDAFGTRMNTWQALSFIIDDWMMGGSEKYPSIVIDEFNTALERILGEMRLSGKFAARGGRGNNEFAVYAGLADFVRWVMSAPGRTGKALGLVAHPSTAKDHEEGPLAGRLKYKEGPKAPSGGVTRQIAADSTFLFRLALVEKPGLAEEFTRVAMTGPHPLYEQGKRDSRIPDLINIETEDVRGMLLAGGWPI